MTQVDPAELTIATWFVADTSRNATHFPQVGGDSSTLTFQKVYWRCIVGFFATSVIHNPNASYRFYTNAPIPIIDGFDVAAFLCRCRVQTIHLDISYRLPKDVASAWGNQLYILDIIKHFVKSEPTSQLVVLDSDCIWNGNAVGLQTAIDEHGCLTYTLDDSEHPPLDAINGITRQDMKRALLAWQSASVSCDASEGIYYHGGEIFAATVRECKRLGAEIDALWNWQAEHPDRRGFLEEAHFLSILYAQNGYQPFTANPFIKRMWTTFKHNNLNVKDRALTIWHLPAEKKSGFKALFEVIKRDALSKDIRELEIQLAGLMGVPRRTAVKFVRDLSCKVIEKVVNVLIRLSRSAFR
jgi:hypothetical protein